MSLAMDNSFVVCKLSCFWRIVVLFPLHTYICKDCSSEAKELSYAVLVQILSVFIMYLAVSSLLFGLIFFLQSKSINSQKFLHGTKMRVFSIANSIFTVIVESEVFTKESTTAGTFFVNSNWLQWS